MREPEIIFAIHDFNQRGGQDRSTLEIVQHLGERKKIELHAFTFEADRPHANIEFRRVRSWGRRPALLRILFYHLVTSIRFRKRGHRRAPICATGACSLVSDIVHVQFVHASWRRARAKASPYARLVAAYNLLTEKLTFSRDKTYIAISHAVKHDMEREYGLRKISVVHHGVDPKRFHPCSSAAEKRELRAKLAIPPGPECVLLFVGTYERKGLDVILRALSSLPEESRRSVRLVAVGAGDRRRYGEMARALGIAPIVSLVPPKSNIEEYFRAADVFVFPTSYEPFGLVILEAMASGLPCIVSRLAGASELLQHGESGLLLENPADPAEVATDLAELALDEDKRVRMGRLARAKAETRDWAQVAREYEAVVRDWSATARRG